MQLITRRFLLSVATAVGAVGCSATPYQSDGLAGGYSDRKLDDVTWYVRFDGNSYSTAGDVFIFWLYRDAEITLREDFTHFRSVQRRAGIGFGAKPWCDGTVQLLRDVPKEQRSRVYDAQLVLREHKGKVRA